MAGCWRVCEKADSFKPAQDCSTCSRRRNSPAIDFLCHRQARLKYKPCQDASLRPSHEQIKPCSCMAWLFTHKAVKKARPHLRTTTRITNFLTVYLNKLSRGRVPRAPSQQTPHNSIADMQMGYIMRTRPESTRVLLLRTRHII